MPPAPDLRPPLPPPDEGRAAPPTSPAPPISRAPAATTATGNPRARPPAPPPGPGIDERLHCPHCNYDLTGLDAADTCPECGRAITADDRRYQLRRQIFLSLTTLTPWWRLAVLGVIGLIGYAWPLLFVIPALIVAVAWFTGEAARDAAQHRLVRRLWLINLCWLQLPWVVPILGRLAVEAIAWSPFDIIGLGNLWYDDYDDFQVRTTVIFACLGAIAAVPMWAWRWRALARTAGATALAADTRRAGLRWALRVCLWPMYLPLLIVTVSWVIVRLADAFLPGWG